MSNESDTDTMTEAPARPSATRSLRRTLGKGLGALLGEAAEDYAQLDRVSPRAAEGSAPALTGSRTLPIDWVVPGPFQPRRTFKAEALDNLAQSLRQRGVLQPLVVRKDPSSAQSYQIIAGERRWRAAQKAGLHEVPVIIRDLTDGEALEISIIENVQREDLSPIEEADGYQRLLAEFQYTHDDVARLIGKSRSYITNALRLLRLPEKIKARIDAGEVSAGHARAILAAGTSEELMDRILSEGLSVREAEELARQAADAQGKKRRAPPQKNADTAALEREISQTLGLSVKISAKGPRGVVSIRYLSLDQLDDVVARLTGER